MNLERVSFKKGREHKPRLSAPYVPGKTSKRYWSDEENKILFDHYETKGAAYCLSKLPGRTKLSVYQQTQKLGLRQQAPKRIRSREEYAAIDARIQEIFPTLDLPPGAVNGANKIAEILNEPRWLISDRLLKLGLTRRRVKEPAWSTAEEELMKRVPLHDPEKCTEIFKAHGFTRTPHAIVVKAKRLHLSRRYKDTFSATGAAKILGLDSKTISVYCLKGTIRAGRRKTNRLPQQGGDWHSIERADLRQFVIDNLDLLDFRKVDKFALVDLLVAGGGHDA